MNTFLDYSAQQTNLKSQPFNSTTSEAFGEEGGNDMNLPFASPMKSFMNTPSFPIITGNNTMGPNTNVPNFVNNDNFIPVNNPPPPQYSTQPRIDVINGNVYDNNIYVGIADSRVYANDGNDTINIMDIANNSFNPTITVVSGGRGEDTAVLDGSWQNYFESEYKHPEEQDITYKMFTSKSTANVVLLDQDVENIKFSQPGQTTNQYSPNNYNNYQFAYPVQQEVYPQPTYSSSQQYENDHFFM